MTARYVLSKQARQDLTEIAEYIANETGLAQAERVVRELQRNFELLAERPDVGPGRADITDDPALRFWIVYSYLVVFVPGRGPLAVVSILHGARDPIEIARQLREAQTEDE
jgi:toxin ParE1/3/4